MWAMLQLINRPMFSLLAAAEKSAWNKVLLSCAGEVADREHRINRLPNPVFPFQAFLLPSLFGFSLIQFQAAAQVSRDRT